MIATPANSLAQDPEMVSDSICEPREHLASIESRMLVLEQNPADMEALHSAFRGFHTIKGLAGLLRMKLAGARTIAQDERSSVVFRVPRGSHPHRGSAPGGVAGRHGSGDYGGAVSGTTEEPARG